MFPVRDLGGMHPVCTGELVDRFEPFDRVQGDPSFELSTITFPLCRHLLSPPPSHIDTAFYLNHLSSFRGTLYLATFLLCLACPSRRLARAVGLHILTSYRW